MNKNNTIRAIVDDGTKAIPLVNQFGKEICTLYIRPADYSILDRYKTLTNDFEKIVEPLKNVSITNNGTSDFEEEWAVIKQVEGEIVKRLNALFDMDEAAKIFEKRHAFSSVGGQFFCEKVIAALGEIIAQEMAEENAKSEARMKQYMPTKDDDDARETTAQY